MRRIFVLRSEKQVERLVGVVTGHWKAQADAGHPLEVSVQEYRQKPTAAQRRALWRCLRIIAEQVVIDGVRHAAEAWDEYFKRRFIGYHDLPGGGMVGLSTTGLSADEFSGYIAKIEHYAAENYGVIFGGEDGS